MFQQCSILFCSALDWKSCDSILLRTFREKTTLRKLSEIFRQLNASTFHRAFMRIRKWELMLTTSRRDGFIWIAEFRSSHTSALHAASVNTWLHSALFSYKIIFKYLLFSLAWQKEKKWHIKTTTANGKTTLLFTFPFFVFAVDFGERERNRTDRFSSENFLYKHTHISLLLDVCVCVFRCCYFCFVSFFRSLPILFTCS